MNTGSYVLSQLAGLIVPLSSENDVYLFSGYSGPVKEILATLRISRATLYEYLKK